MVLEKFQDQICMIKKRKYVTFKNKGDCLFDDEQAKIIHSKLEVKAPRPQTPEPTSPKLEDRGSISMTERRDTTLDEESIGMLTRPNLAEGWPLTKHDLIKQVMNLMVEQGHKDVVK